jgi:hypothetical protein
VRDVVVVNTTILVFRGRGYYSKIFRRQERARVGSSVKNNEVSKSGTFEELNFRPSF